MSLATLYGLTLVGFTGRRHQGKSTAAEILVNEYGFHRVHAFEGGKEATRAYFEYVTKCGFTAYEMVYGSLKDKPSEFLPGNASPRYFMERFGQFMGIQMGTEWTLEMEIKRAVRAGHKRIVAESLIYEDESFKAMGGRIGRIERLDYDAPDVQSDHVQSLISEDYKVQAATLEALAILVREMMLEQHMLLPRVPMASSQRCIITERMNTTL